MWNDPDYLLNGTNTWTFSSRHTGGVHFVIGDGSVRFLSGNIDGQLLMNLASREDGNPVGEF